MDKNSKSFKFYVGQNTYLLGLSGSDIKSAMKIACKHFGIYDTTILKETEERITFSGFVGIEGYDKKEFKYRVVAK